MLYLVDLEHDHVNPFEATRFINRLKVSVKHESGLIVRLSDYRMPSLTLCFTSNPAGARIGTARLPSALCRIRRSQDSVSVAIPLCIVPVLEFLPRKDVRRRNQHIQGLECRKEEDRDSTRGILRSVRVDSLHIGTHGRWKVVFLTDTRHSKTQALPSGCW